MNLSISNATKNKLLVLLFLIFILNTIFIAIASNNQQNDAIQINVAGQQRLLLRTIETHILAINMTEEHHSDLIMSRSQFEQNHIDIRFGNKEKNIKPIKSQGSIQLFTS
ncbi:MAG: type IV pili methyl-accepting chemotaxis transducer N-terminal domain-containing protein, partial [Candidatus Heimdallarchaeota archaeon]|nr:type IV pili methyl-accepting chemotaxis transducer N-terminal domain-containing protein [Candidatus Heimdallarchaeota archaeon]